MTDSQTGSGHCLKTRVLIVTVQEFNSNSNLSKRVGASRDTKELHKVLFKLGFQVTFKIDYTAEEILQEYKQESLRDHGSCFISIISSHGEEGIIYGSDGCPVKLQDIYSMFTPQSCPSLAGKPKIFFIQACRGQQPDEGVYLQTDGVTETDSGCAIQNAYSHYEAVPEDTTVHFSTCSDYAAFRRPGEGSIFLQTLCKVLMGEQRHWELLRIMTRVNGLVAWTFESKGLFMGKKQMPCFVSRMCHEIFPFSDRPTPAVSTACITTASTA
ncbi:caspase-7-like [Stegostoma tigrinum]|uniref:caspase-7-like n=1 Tax=Stegostoma tigrinum TaxID=3053191 RepID=UPI00287046C6|nr:caspase-7-like [Stegostoma tigrinum]XP_059497080.1 caspase-7-like [Stegostoma tigrinum]